MQDNKEWNNIRDNVVDVFDENNTFNQAKEFSNKALDILRRVGNPIQYNKNVNVNTVPKKVKEKKKTYLKASRGDLLLRIFFRNTDNDNFCYTDVCHGFDGTSVFT